MASIWGVESSLVINLYKGIILETRIYQLKLHSVTYLVNVYVAWSCTT